MREILFRGFHPCDGPDIIVVDGEKVKGRWVEGYIVKHPSAIQIGNDYSPWYIHVPPVDPDDNGGVFNVLPSTVGQSTGLTDWTGKRIFEGDVLRITKEALPDVTVKFVNQAWFMCHGEDPVALLCQENIEGFGTEVIGTVFDEEAHQ